MQESAIDIIYVLNTNEQTKIIHQKMHKVFKAKNF